MKQLFKTIIILFVFGIVSTNVMADTEVTIGCLKYSLSGKSATITGYVAESLPKDLVISEEIEYNNMKFSVVGIKDEAFKGCATLVTVNIPETVKYIGGGGQYENGGCFMNCSNLEVVRLTGTTSIGNFAFYGCSKLRYIDFGNKLTYIYRSAFHYCASLTYLVFPSTLTSITYSNAFNYCDLVQSIIYLGEKTIETGIKNVNIYHPIDFVSFDSSDFLYSGKTPSPVVSNNLPSGFKLQSHDISSLNKNAGSYTQNIPFTFANDDMSFDVEIPYTYTINPVTLKAKINDATRQYGEADPQFSTTYTGFVNNEDVRALTSLGNYTTTATATSDVGTYTIKQSGATAKNYVFEYEDGTLTVSKAPLTAAVNNYTRKYGEANPAFEIAYTGLKNGETAPVWTVEPEISTKATQQSDVDVYEIKAVGGEPKNYEMSGITSGSLSITPASLTIKANDFSRLYYEDNPEFTLTYTGFVGDDDPSVLTTSPQINTSATKNSKAGEYTIEVSNAASKNYTISFEKGKLSINKRQLTVSTKDYTRAYNEENPSFELSYIGFVNSEDEKVLLSKPKATTDATSSSDVGTYSITIGDGVAENYDFNYVNGKLTIEKAYQTLTWDQVLSDVKQYDQVELTATASSGLEVTYSIEGSRICSIVKTGVKQHIDSYTTGESVISAVQSGNKNYWPTTKQYKQILIKPLSSIRGDVNNDGVVNAADVVTVTNIIMGTE